MTIGGWAAATHLPTERDAAQAQRRLRDAKPLIDQGIIPRQEYEDLRHQAEAQASALAAAREDLGALLRRGPAGGAEGTARPRDGHGAGVAPAADR